MNKIIVDIETSGVNFETLDEKSQEYLLKFAQSEEEKEKIKSSLALYPLTGEIVVIGMLNPDTNQGSVFFQNNGGGKENFKEDNIFFENG